MKCVHTFLGNVNEMLILCYIFKLLKKKNHPFHSCSWILEFKHLGGHFRPCCSGKALLSSKSKQGIK